MKLSSVLATTLTLGGAFALPTSIKAVCNSHSPRESSPSGPEYAQSLRDVAKSYGHKLCEVSPPESHDAGISYRSGPTVFRIVGNGPAESYNDCQFYFEEVIEQCIAQQNVWGGILSVDGVLYEISNDNSTNQSSDIATRAQRSLIIDEEDRGDKILERHDNELSARADDEDCEDEDDVPSVEEIKEHIKMPDSSCLFYSGPGGYHQKALDWRFKSKKLQWRTLSLKWSTEGYDDQFLGEPVKRKEFDVRASQAMAEMCTGTAYVMLPSDTKGTDWSEDTVWNKYEWPNLKKVTTVLRISPEYIENPSKEPEKIKG